VERRRRFWGLVTGAGAVLLAASALADVLGYGDPGFGWQQTLGTVVGALAVVLGLAWMWLGRTRRGASSTG
jgi:peptidoglycan/LPS O-acetylase OafA/YrhL